MELALSEGNVLLSKNKSDEPQDAINNCHNCAINLTKDGRVDSKPLTKLYTDNSFVTYPHNFDNALLASYKNVGTPNMGDVIRYSNDGKKTSHGSVLLLQNDNGVQMFTKNGYQNSQLYQIMMQTNIIIEVYGNPTGIQGREVPSKNARGEDIMIKINHKSPYYRY